MLPSTALLSAFECPFYRRGQCPRPFCQFQHVESACNFSSTSPRGFESHPAISTETQNNEVCLLELEKINKQIESAKCEVEKQQRKLSYFKTIGTEKKDQRFKSSSSSESPNKKDANQRSSNKYVVGKSRPLTDLEYDPCSNFVSGLMSNGAKSCKDTAPTKPEKEHSLIISSQIPKECQNLDETDDEPLVIDLTSQEEESKDDKRTAQTRSTEKGSTESPPKHIHKSQRYKDISEDRAPSLTKPPLQVLEPPGKSVERADIECGSALQCFERDGAMVLSPAPPHHKAQVTAPDVGPSAIGESPEGQQSAVSSYHKADEKGADILNVLESLCAAFDDFESQSGTAGCIALTEPTQKMNGDNPDAGPQEDDPDLRCNYQELKVQLASLETALGVFGSCDKPTPPSAMLQSRTQHIVNPDEHLHLPLPTITSPPLVMPSPRSYAEVYNEPITDCPLVQHVTREVHVPKPVPQALVTGKGLAGGESLLQPQGNANAQIASNPNLRLMAQNPLVQASVGENVVGQANGAPHTPPVPSATVPKGMRNNREVILISSESEDELNYSDFDLSESDPMEECYRIFMEGKEEEENSNMHSSSPVVDRVAATAKAAEANVKANVEGMEKGPKNRIAHKPKSEVAMKPKTQVIIPFEGEPVRFAPVAARGPQQSQQLQQPMPVLTTTIVRRVQPPCTTTTIVRRVQPPCATTTHPPLLTRYPQPTLHPSLTPVHAIGAFQLPPNARLILPQSHSAVPVIVPVLYPPQQAPVPQPIQLTQPKPMPTKRKAKGKSKVEAKVPHNVRQRYLNIFVEEFLKTAPLAEAFQKALIEEKAVYDRSINELKYLSVAVNALKRLRNQSTTSSTDGARSSTKEAKGHISLKSCSLHGSGDSGLYEGLKGHILSEDVLRRNNYPLQHPGKAGWAVQHGEVKKTINDAFKRMCCRCGATFNVNQAGKHTRKEECTYHHGKVVENKVPGGVESRYGCCEGAVGTTGCQVFKLHVHDSCSLSGFVRTLPASTDVQCCPGIYAIDCEMCYTTQGLELTRVTVVNSSLLVVYDSFVKPESEVIDYNTRFSGISEKDVKGASVSLKDVQNVLLTFISEDTILIGHELDQDLCALKLLHSVVVDTSVSFPHRLGPPHKLELHHLTADYLRKIIQEGEDGRDTGENATACMQLMLWRVKEDSKVRKW